ncbi:MAG TPA: peptidyl-prolyl cis-trans isomerase [Pyrinomonadaceae bacterium]|nr:peptidyl-prolyl cis-trans isomerase [Pyrinomonadaceae bacterium]
MKNFTNRFAFFTLFAVLTAISALPIHAQETEERVVDEVVAQVNEGVITLSRVKREMKGIIDAEVQQGKKREEAEKMVEEKRGELIANLINEELMVQRAKELGLDSEVDANVNRRFLDIMKQYNLKTLDALYKQMEESNVDPQEIREMWRKQAIREMLLQKEVQGKLYWGFTSKELKDYFEKNKAKFTKPETVSVSEIFLGFAGRDENAVREKAKALVTQLRAGGDFTKISAENSDPGVVTQGKGSSEKLKVDSLSDQLKNALNGVKVGGFTEPIEAAEVGIVILRIDTREQASSESFFDENTVRMAMMSEQAPAEQKKFFATLRGDSYIKISDSYRPLVSPILFAEERKEKPAN